MAYDINAALERLEKNLSEVESARKQVEAIVATSEKLQSIIKQYSDTLVTLNQEVGNFIAEVNKYRTLKTSELEAAINKIKTACEDVINKFNEDINSSTDLFKEKFTETINAFGSENDRLAEQVRRLDSLHGTITDTTNELTEIKSKLEFIVKFIKDSQGEQDKALADIKSSVDAIPTSVKADIDAAVEIINGHASNLNTKADDIKAETDSAIQKLENINTIVTETKAICNGIKTDIANLKNSMDSGISALGGAININRWIIIIGIIALIALHFINI